MAKDWEDKGYWGKRDSLDQIGESLGYDYRDYSDNDTETGRNYTSKGTREDYENAVINAAEHSAIYQGALQAGKASDNKRFASLGDGISNAAELGNLHTAMKKTHKDMGNTGNYSSANDRGNVTSYLMQQQMDKFGSKFATSQAVDDLKAEMSLNQQSAQAGSGTEMKPVEYSEEIQQAKFAQDPSQINIYESTNVDGEGGAGELTGVSEGDSQRDAASKSFLDQYKVDLIKGLKLTPTLS